MSASKAGLLGLVMAASSTLAGAQEAALRAQRMPFGECLALIDEVADELGSSGVVRAHTGDMQWARIEAADGFVTVICKRADQTVTLLRTAS